MPPRSCGRRRCAKTPVIVDLTKHSKKLGKAVVKKKDGTSLYLTRDIGEARQRVDKYNFE
jgi:arginyl-tRNA synthetase